MSDHLLEATREHWPAISAMFGRFADRRPVMLFDIEEQRVYAYPYADFAKELSDRSQQLLEKQYEEAIRQNEIVVFVRDNEHRCLVSFTLRRE